MRFDGADGAQEIRKDVRVDAERVRRIGARVDGGCLAVDNEERVVREDAMVKHGAISGLVGAMGDSVDGVVVEHVKDDTVAGGLSDFVGGFDVRDVDLHAINSVSVEVDEVDLQKHDGLRLRCDGSIMSRIVWRVSMGLLWVCPQLPTGVGW